MKYTTETDQQNVIVSYINTNYDPSDFRVFIDFDTVTGPIYVDITSDKKWLKFTNYNSIIIYHPIDNNLLLFKQLMHFIYKKLLLIDNPIDYPSIKFTMFLYDINLNNNINNNNILPINQAYLSELHQNDINDILITNLPLIRALLYYPF